MEDALRHIPKEQTVLAPMQYLLQIFPYPL